MAARCKTLLCHFHAEREETEVKIFSSSISWSALTRGITRQFFRLVFTTISRKATHSYLKERVTRNEDYDYLRQLGLSTSIYTCRLRVGDDCGGEREYSSRDSNNSSIDSKTGCRTRLVVRIPKIPKAKRGLRHERAMAFAVLGENIGDISIPDFVHVKWATDFEQLNFLYHEAQVYENLRSNHVIVTPEFYGYYQKYAGEDLFAVSVFERCTRPPSTVDKKFL